MKLTYLGHSCFVLESYGFQALLDPYRDIPGLPDIAMTADAVYCSHGHSDHAYADEATLTTGKVNPFTVREIDTFHDSQGGALRGRNTVRAFTSEGLTVAHLGDLGHPLTAEQLEKLGPCDVLLLPVGGTYTIDKQEAKAVAEAVKPRVTIPMHYREGKTGLEILTTLEEFLDLYPVDRIRRYPGNVLELHENMTHQIAALHMDAHKRQGD